MKHMMRICLQAAFIALSLVSAFPVSGLTAPAPLPDPVALVNGSAISRAELNREIARLQRGEQRSVNGLSRDRDSNRLQEALDNLIDRELLYQEARKNGMNIPAAAVEQEIARLKNRSGSAIEFDKTLKELDLSEEAILFEAERSMTVRRFINLRFSPGIAPTDEEVTRYYADNPALFVIPEQVRLRHILVKIEPRWQLKKKEEARAKALEIIGRLRKGEDFGAVARAVSDCESREKGGDLGWFKKGELAPFVEQSVFPLTEGGMTEPIVDRFGYHIIQISGRRAARIVSFPEAKPKIIEQLRQELAVKQARDFARKLRSGARVDIFIEPAGT